ncbi:MAG TPA: hypothetical protein VFC51_10335 [Chloroflexota bacterium]|nr:hypothetical protein [Chloroflexota bacterium]
MRLIFFRLLVVILLLQSFAHLPQVRAQDADEDSDDGPRVVGVSEYISLVNNATNRLNRSADLLVSLVNNPRLDDTWWQQLDEIVESDARAYESVATVQPPDCLSQYHDRLLEAFDLHQQVTQTVAAAMRIDKQDPQWAATMRQATDLRAQENTRMKEAQLFRPSNADLRDNC